MPEAFVGELSRPLKGFDDSGRRMRPPHSPLRNQVSNRWNRILEWLLPIYSGVGLASFHIIFTAKRYPGRGKRYIRRVDVFECQKYPLIRYISTAFKGSYVFGAAPPAKQWVYPLLPRCLHDLNVATLVEPIRKSTNKGSWDQLGFQVSKKYSLRR